MLCICNRCPLLWAELLNSFCSCFYCCSCNKMWHALQNAAPKNYQTKIYCSLCLLLWLQVHIKMYSDSLLPFILSSAVRQNYLMIFLFVLHEWHIKSSLSSPFQKSSLVCRLILCLLLLLLLILCL